MTRSRLSSSFFWDKMTLKIDLHCHSTVSDGVLSPEQVVARAHGNGVQVLALTDHDETAGLGVAGQCAAQAGMHFVPGVEVSVTWAGRTVHIVGLNVDPDDRDLNNGLAEVRGGRLGRAREMADRLESLGFSGAYDGAMAFVSNPELVSRTHFARFMVQQGHCRNMQEVFERYLGDRGPANVPVRWAALDQAVGWIRGAGGIAVIAHPGRYDYTPQQFDQLFAEFRDLGGQAIEVVTGSHHPDEYAIYARVARKYGFLASAGSDFHGPDDGRMELGELPPLPSGLTPVWHDWF